MKELQNLGNVEFICLHHAQKNDSSWIETEKENYFFKSVFGTVRAT